MMHIHGLDMMRGGENEFVTVYEGKSKSDGMRWKTTCEVDQWASKYWSERDGRSRIECA